jgi:hypothetical protein
MDLQTLSSWASRLFFGAAILMAAIAVFEKIANQLGYTFIGGFFGPFRLLELSTVTLMFVVAILLRQIREELKARGT